jgi:hypothetical protein
VIAFSDAFTSGLTKALDRLPDRGLRGRQLVVARDLLDVHLLEVAGRKLVDEPRIAQDLVGVDRLPSALCHLDVVGDRADDAG